MEAYYHSNPKIEEWVEQIIENIFTACLLSGSDSDAEYQRGCQLIAKITSVLQEFSTLPAEYLADGLKQIIEQQLPDSRVISNFPTFQETMKRMINEGIHQPQSVLSLVHEEKEIDLIGNSQSERWLNQSGAQNNKDELKDIEPISNILDTTVIGENKYLDKEIETIAPTNLNRDRFKIVLKHIFPSEVINWDINLKGETFFAQVKDVLIYCSDSDSLLEEKTFTKDGWKILKTLEEDFGYPRRLEREIKNLLRKKTNIK